MVEYEPVRKVYSPADGRTLVILPKRFVRECRIVPGTKVRFVKQSENRIMLVLRE